ncbi:MAG TPA: glycosyltransferase [Edaphobacter sp.]|nr:glycosyltransferase [Edaphobacter sp.]
MTETIPKRIIQTDKSADLPLLAKAAASNLRLLNPDFEYLFFDNFQVEKFIDAEFPKYRPVFDSFTARIQRYDFFRYLAVYRFGGFYFDTDVFLACGLEDLREFGCVFPFEHLSMSSFLCEEYGMDWEVGNYAFGAAAGHPFLEAIIKNVVRAQQHPEWAEAMTKSIPRIFRSEYSVLATTGPGLVSRTLAEYSAARDQVKVLFPEDVCDQDSWFRFGNYGVHLQAGTWRTRERLVRRVLHRRWASTIRKSLLKESLKRGGKRTLDFRSSTAQRQEASRLSNALG